MPPPRYLPRFSEFPLQRFDLDDGATQSDLKAAS